MPVPYAFSIHHFVSSVGADAGFAAIVGLAILVLLYFAQARETSSLRDQSIAASQRVAELEARLAQLGSSQANQVAPSGAAERVAIPAAPAGVAAPALAAATRLIPLPHALSLSPSPATPRPVTAAAAAATAAPSVAPAPPEAPATAGSGSNGTGEHAVPRPAAPAPVAAAPPRPAQARANARFTPASSLTRPPATSRPARRRWIPAAVAVLLAIAAVAVLLVVTSSGSSTHSTAGVQTTNAPGPKAGFQPRSVTVAVLNGTDVFQLAHRVALRLHRAGYRDGTVATATDQTHSATVVAYLAGHRHAAAEVASALKLPPSSVQAADQSSQAIACPPPAACRADVIVTVGSDLSSTP